MVIESPQELIRLWEQILTGTYISTSSPPASVSASSESFDEALVSEVDASQPPLEPEENMPLEPTPAEEGPTQPQILASGSAIIGAAASLWQSLDEETQAITRAQAQILASQAATRAKAYWNALSPEQQDAALPNAREKAQSAKAFEISLPA